ncbi:uncharacterized protein LOC122341931 isoform X2 [Puntigrus tetrazona]|uniref:uncharacterized protein LOC122341931 isoform X2 n=1 Tax=Puntigrus tetrazona TaxID=1606681 RepID=UPI001C88F66C|nr:uncharacterized protein LOC122341931 isoform X2 [Puntigrus tetrazona]
MQLANCVLLLIPPMIARGLFVHSPSGPLVAPLGSSVVLPCYVDELLSMRGLEVEWRRADLDTLVHLYQDGESRPESQEPDYQDRANFFTDQIQHGNFSLRLDNLRPEDEGRYTCKVYSQNDSGETVIQIKDVERLLVSGSSRSISASVGEDVTLNCSVDSHITPEHIEEVSWKKTDADEDILVLLYQNNKILPDSSHERYRDRAEFFTAEISKGNFSLRLKSVRTEDKGVYMCQVFAGGLSANATVKLELGFSILHTIMAILCITASGSALLLFFLIYCTSHNNDTVFRLQMFLVFGPNILLFLAFVLWGVSEGSLFEWFSCSALYFLRPLMLLWAAPYVNDFTGNNKTWIVKYSFRVEYIIFSAVFYSVLFKSAWQKSLSYTGFESIVIPVLFVIVILLNLFYIIYLLARFINKLSERTLTRFGVLVGTSFNIVPAFQFILLFFTFGSGRGGLLIVASLPVLLAAMRYDWDRTCGNKMGCSALLMRIVWLILLLVVNAAIVFFYIITLENEKDSIGWACTIGFLQALWAVINFTRSFDFELLRAVPVYVFGSVIAVILNSATLTTELVLKAVNGDRVFGDLRIITFSTESIFALSLLSLQVFEPWMRTYLQSHRDAAGSDGPPASESNQTRTARESFEINPLLNGCQDAARRNRRHSV